MLIPLGTVLVDTRHVAPEQTVEVLDRDGVNVTYGAFLVAVAYEAIFGKVLVQAGILLGIIHHHAHFGQPVHLGSRDKVSKSLISLSFFQSAVRHHCGSGQGGTLVAQGYLG